MRAAGVRQFLAFFFHAQGRISRAEYALGIGLIYAVYAAILGYVLGHTAGERGGLALAAVIGLPLLIGVLVLIVKRCHDFGLPGSFVLLLAVPMIGLLWIVALAFIPGNPRPNPYGQPPTFRDD
jgi:uncharacterized membrane protein YhaH (DUF805 family)